MRQKRKKKGPKFCAILRTEILDRNGLFWRTRMPCLAGRNQDIKICFIPLIRSYWYDKLWNLDEPTKFHIFFLPFNIFISLKNIWIYIKKKVLLAKFATKTSNWPRCYNIIHYMQECEESCRAYKYAICKYIQRVIYNIVIIKYWIY